MPADTSEKGLETILVEGLCARGWEPGKPGDYNRSFALDLVQLRQFLEDTQPELAAQLDLDPASPAGLKTLARIQGEITRRGVIEVLRERRSARPAPDHAVLRDTVEGQHRRPRPCSPRTASPSPASSTTPRTRPSSPSTSPCSSTGFRSARSS